MWRYTLLKYINNYNDLLKKNLLDALFAVILLNLRVELINY